MNARWNEYAADIRAMLRIALPLALAELGWMGMGVVDTIMVGRLPDSAIAIGATSVGGAIFYGVAIFGLGLMSGLDALVSHAYGAGNHREIRRAMRAGLLLSALSTPVLMAIVLLFVPLLGAIGVDAPVRESASGFLDVLVWSLPLLLIYTVLRRYLQGVHHVRPVAWALISSNIINAVGNWILIYGRCGAPAMGVKGSALSTVISRVYLAAFLVVAIRRRDPQAFHSDRVRWADIRQLLVLGFPAALAIGFEIWIFNLATAVVATLDPVSLAAHTIALNAAAVTYMVPLGISSAAAVSVGRFRGARDSAGAARAGWTAIGLSIGFELLSASTFLLFPRPIAEAYTNDPRVVSFGIRLLAIAAAFQLFDGVQATAGGALRGLANTKMPMLWSLFAYWIVGLPAGYWLCYREQWGAYGIWWGFCLAVGLIAFGLVVVWGKESATEAIQASALVDNA